MACDGSDSLFIRGFIRGIATPSVGLSVGLPRHPWVVACFSVVLSLTLTGFPIDCGRSPRWVLCGYSFLVLPLNCGQLPPQSTIILDSDPPRHPRLVSTHDVSRCHFVRSRDHGGA